MSFDDLRFLHLLWIVLGLIGLAAYGFARKRMAMARFASADLLSSLSPRVSPARQRLKSVYMIVGLVFIVAGLMGPRWGEELREFRRKGIDIMVCLDVSRSMLAGDIVPNRLDRAKADIRDLLSILPGDRIGLIAFAGKAELKCPLTIDYGFYRLVLDEIDTSSVAVGGSLIGDAIRLASSSFTDQVKNHKVILVITDGEDHESFPTGAAGDAYEEHGIRVFTIGLGDAAAGQRIPVNGPDGQTAFLQYEGQEVWSKLDPEMLTRMAVVGGGAYVPAGTRNIDIEGIYNEHIATLDEREFEAATKVGQVPRFQWFVAAALVILLLETLTAEWRPVHGETQKLRKVA
jgi:Ca-activated chloride channel family protein